MHGFIKPNGYLCALWEVQGGRCFHCDGPMIFIRGDNLSHGDMATREHIFPRATRGHGIINNIVLAHGRCNNNRGCPEFPTEDEIARTKAIYAQLGLVAFVPDKDHTEATRQWALIVKVTEEYAKPTLADVWPK